MRPSYFLAMVVTRILLCVLECWYWVTNWIAPRPPWGTGALCYTHKKTLRRRKITIVKHLSFNEPNKKEANRSHCLKSLTKQSLHHITSIHLVDGISVCA